MKRSLRYLFTLMLIPMLLVVGNTSVKALEIYTNYYGIEMTEDEYATLINLGFTEEEIYIMDKDTFIENKDLDATLLAREVRYYKTISNGYGIDYTVETTEDEYNSFEASNMIRGTVTTTYKRMVSTLSANGSRYRYKNTLNWLNIPSKRSYDIIGIGFNNSNIYIYSTVYFNSYYYDSNGTVHNSSTYANKKSISTGGAVSYQLPTGTVIGMGSTIYYDVEKNTSGTINTLSLCGDYSHATSTVQPSEVSHYTIHYGGIDLNADIINKYDAIGCAYASASVNW